MDNAADRKSIRAKEKVAQLAERARQDVLRNIMSTIEGREWMWNILSEAHIFRSTFNGDALQSAFNEGQRAVGLAILADILIACPDQYIQAQRESHERHHRDNAIASTLAERRRGEVDDGRDTGREGHEASEASDAGYVNDDNIYDRAHDTADEARH